MFGESEADASTPRLYSIGEDRNFIEYEIQRSLNNLGVKVPACIVIQMVRTSVCYWHRAIFVTYINDLVPAFWKRRTGITMQQQLQVQVIQCKFKSLPQDNPCTYLCRPSCEVIFFLKSNDNSRLENIPSRSDKCYLAYATREKVIGIIQQPLDGNPSRAIGVIGHAGEVSATIFA